VALILLGLHLRNHTRPWLKQMTSSGSFGSSLDVADTRLAQEIAQLPGVGLVTICGGQKPAVRIQVRRLAVGVGRRHWLGAKAPAGNLDRRWVDRESDAHAVHDAGNLSLSGSSSSAIEA
jgi:hypothetical protein